MDGDGLNEQEFVDAYTDIHNELGIEVPWWL